MLTLNGEVKISDIVILFAFIGLVLNWWQIRKNNKDKRSEFLVNLSNQWVINDDMKHIFYKIEYNNFVYHNQFHGSDEEKKLDKLLHYFDNIAHLYSNGIMNLEDLSFLSYEFLKCYQSEGVQSYLDFLDHYAYGIQEKHRPFYHFKKVGEMLQSAIQNNRN